MCHGWWKRWHINVFRIEQLPMQHFHWCPCTYSKANSSCPQCNENLPAPAQLSRHRHKMKSNVFSPCHQRVLGDCSSKDSVELLTGNTPKGPYQGLSSRLSSFVIIEDERVLSLFTTGKQVQFSGSPSRHHLCLWMCVGPIFGPWGDQMGPLAGEVCWNNSWDVQLIDIITKGKNIFQFIMGYIRQLLSRLPWAWHTCHLQDIPSLMVHWEQLHSVYPAAPSWPWTIQASAAVSHWMGSWPNWEHIQYPAGRYSHLPYTWHDSSSQSPFVMNFQILVEICKQQTQFMRLLKRQIVQSSFNINVTSFWNFKGALFIQKRAYP